MVVLAVLVAPSLVQAFLQSKDQSSFYLDAPRISKEDIDASGLYIGHPSRLYCTRSRGMVVAENLGTVTINNIMWVEGVLAVLPGTQLKVVGTVFFGDLAPGTAERLTAADTRSSIGPPYITAGEWEAVGELRGPGKLRRSGGDPSI